MNNNQIIVFTLGEEEYGLDITCVKEIVRLPAITKIPNMHVFMEGIINLRDKVIPVLDLKKKFGLVQSERSEDSRLLVLDLEGMVLGIIVDDVSEVLKADSLVFEKLSMKTFGASGNSIEGILKIDRRLILLLDASEFTKEILTNEQ